jgi:putative endonuclease
MTKTLGKKGEQQAIIFLEKRGYRILAKNFRNRFGEIDIIAQDKNELIFVEVKTRTSDSYGTPEEAVNANKLKKIMMVASEFMREQSLEDVQPRFEVVSIVDGKTLELISNIHIDKEAF